MSEQNNASVDLSGRKINAVATTNIVGDMVEKVGGKRVNLTVLMGPGVDPHLYKASEGDVQRMATADIIFYNGLHLEGKMTEVFEQMKRHGIPTVAVAEKGVPRSKWLESEAFTGNYDPHVWFDVQLWGNVAGTVGKALAEIDTAHAQQYKTAAEEYHEELMVLDQYVNQRAKEVPASKRVLITSHDAFSYFGRAYGFEVYGLQGISTALEAGTADVQQLAAFVAQRRIPAIFVESSVPPRGIQAVREAVKAKGFQVKVGGTLYGDALGDAETPEGSYSGAVRHNIDTVVDGLLEGKSQTVVQQPKR